jgi:citrate synthase
MSTTPSQAAEIPAGFIPARTAAARLGVRLASLYAYVSRGAVRVIAHPADPRARLYAEADIAALIARKARGRRPVLAAATALDWGLPVLTTAISRIADGRLFYRDADAVALAAHATLEDVARLLLRTDRVPFAAGTARRSRGVPAPSGSPPQRAIKNLAAGLSDDRERSGTDQAAAVLRTVVSAVIGERLDARPVHAQIAATWQREDAADIIRRALVLSADHELNASTFAARVAASTGASLTAAVIAALAAFSGARHGGATEDAVSFLRSAASQRRLTQRPLPGFGHPLYPEGDPRAAALLAACPPEPGLRRALDAASRRTGLRPNLDAALATVQLTCRLPEQAAFSIFMVGRTVGWLAHALEQQAGGKLIRPRARYPDATG